MLTWINKITYDLDHSWLLILGEMEQGAEYNAADSEKLSYWTNLIG